MKVYAVYVRFDGDDFHLAELFDTREKAEEYCKQAKIEAEYRKQEKIEALEYGRGGFYTYINIMEVK